MTNPAIRPGPKRPSFSATMKRWGVLYLFVLPGVLLFFVFNYLPMGGLVMVFQHYNPVDGFFGSPWVGMDNFRRIFVVPTFARAFRNTIVISSLRIVFEFPAPILFALLLNEIRRGRTKKIVQTISYMPNFVSWVIVAGIWYKMLSTDGGLVNQILFKLRLIDEPIYFMQEQSMFYPILILTSLWKNLGYATIYYLAAIASVDLEQYEAAAIDGAGRLRQAIHITLPALQGTIVLLLILQFSGILNAGFDQLWTMGNMAVRDVGDILDTAVLRALTSGSLEDLSVAATMGFFKSIVGLILFFAANFISRRLDQESLI